MKSLIVLLTALSMLFPVGAYANGVVEAQVNTSTTLVPATSTVVATRIREQVAITVTTQTFRFEDSLVTNLRYGFPVSSSVTVTGLRYRIGDTWHQAVIRSSDTTISNPVGGNGNAPSSNFTNMIGVLGFVFPLRDTIRGGADVAFELTTVELLPYSRGKVTYTYPVNVLRMVDVNSYVWSVDLRTSRPMFNMSVEPVVEQSERTDTSLAISPISVETTDDIRLSFDQSVDSLAVTMMSSKSANSDGYALLLAVPHVEGTTSIMAKRFTLVVDRSGSMGGDKMEQAKQAAQYCLDRISPFDEVNVIDFDNIATRLYESPKPASSEVVKNCSDRIRGLYPRNGTDITSALLSTFASYHDSSMVNVVVFLTDGVSPINFDRLRTSNTNGTRVFVFGIGSDVNEPDLRRLANEHRGELEVIRIIGSVTDRIGALYERIKDPIIKDPRLTFSPDVMFDFAPATLPNIYAHEQLVVASRYRQAGQVDVSLTGVNVQGTLRNDFSVVLAADDTTAPFVPKIWARLRITTLTDLMSKVALNSDLWREYRDEIIRLGSEFGLVTPFTTFEQGPSDGGGTTSVVASDGPAATTPLGMYPNPASVRSQIAAHFGASHSHAQLSVTDLQGTVVLKINIGAVHAGSWTYDLSLADSNGATLASGSYVVTLTAGTETFTSILRIVQ